MCRNGKQYNQHVHRLILETFVGPALKGMESLHKDGNPAHCRLSNLHWGTRKENQADDDAELGEGGKATTRGQGDQTR